MAKPLVLISSRSFSTGNLDLNKILIDSGCEIRKISNTHDLAEISTDLKEAVAWIAGVAPITSEMLDLAPNLKIISRYGVGVDSVDLSAAKNHGILVANTPGANSKVKMYINGIRISNTAYSISGTTLTYDSTKNGNYTISVGDRIQFDFSY